VNNRPNKKRFENCAIKLILAMAITYLSSVALGSACFDFYAKTSVVAPGSLTFNTPVVKRDMERIAQEVISGLGATEGLTPQYHALINLNLRTYFGLSTIEHQTTKVFEELFEKNESYVRLNKYALKHAEALKSAQELATKLVELKYKAKSKKENAQIQDLLVEYNQQVEHVMWLEREIKQQGNIFNEVTQKMANEYIETSRAHIRTENYLNGLALFTHFLATKAALYPDLHSRLNILIGLFYEDVQTGQRHASQLKALKESIDQQISTNEKILKRFNQNSISSLANVLIEQGVSPNRVTDIVQEIEIAKATAKRNLVNEESKKKSRQGFIEGIKRKTRVATIGLGVIGTLLGGNYALDQYGQRGEAAKKEYVQMMSQKVGSQTSDQKKLMQKYEATLPTQIKDTAVIANASFEVEVFVSNFVKNQTRTDSLNPGDIIYLLNYSPSIVNRSLSKDGSWESNYELVKNIIEINLSRPHTESEKKDLVQSINIIKDGWEAILMEQAKKGYIDQTALPGEIEKNKAAYEKLAAWHLGSFEIKKAHYEAVDLKEKEEKNKADEAQKAKAAEDQKAAQAKLAKEAAWKKLKEGPRHLITDVDALAAISAEQANPVLKGIFESKTQHSVWLQLAAYAEKNTISNSDLFYILSVTKEYEAHLEANKNSPPFLTRVSEFAGLEKDKHWDSTGATDLGSLAIEKVLLNTNLKPVSPTEAVILKKMLEGSGIFNYTGHVQGYRNHVAAYLSSLLNKSLSTKSADAASTAPNAAKP
jgi:hypothetical protein